VNDNLKRANAIIREQKEEIRLLEQKLMAARSGNVSYGNTRLAKNLMRRMKNEILSLKCALNRAEAKGVHQLMDAHSDIVRLQCEIRDLKGLPTKVPPYPQLHTA
jgi:hypothetical protein